MSLSSSSSIGLGGFAPAAPASPSRSFNSVFGFPAAAPPSSSIGAFGFASQSANPLSVGLSAFPSTSSSLHSALHGRRFDDVRRLLSVSDPAAMLLYADEFNVNVPMTALFSCCDDEITASIFKALVKLDKGGESILQNRNSYGDSLLHYAGKYSSVDTVRFLLCVLSPSLVTMPNDDGKSPLDWSRDHDASRVDVISVLAAAAAASERGEVFRPSSKLFNVVFGRHDVTSLSACMKLVEIDPRQLIGMEPNGLKPLENARVDDAPKEVILFLEEKTKTAEEIRDNYPEFLDMSVEEFKERFLCWEKV